MHKLTMSAFHWVI